MVPKNKKRIMITIPKDWDRLILKAKAYSLGESMSNSYLFLYLILHYLDENNYLSVAEYNGLMERYIYDK